MATANVTTITLEEMCLVTVATLRQPSSPVMQGELHVHIHLHTVYICL